MADLFCANCFNSDRRVLEWAHLHHTKKVVSIGAIIRHGNTKKVLAEMEKCVVLCANCHKIYDSKLIIDDKEKTHGLE